MRSRHGIATSKSPAISSHLILYQYYAQQTSRCSGTVPTYLHIRGSAVHGPIYQPPVYLDSPRHHMSRDSLVVVRGKILVFQPRIRVCGSPLLPQVRDPLGLTSVRPARARRCIPGMTEYSISLPVRGRPLFPESLILSSTILIFTVS